MDRFMDRHIVMKYRLKLVALTSLLIAGMFFIPLELQGAYPRYGIHTSVFAVYSITLRAQVYQLASWTSARFFLAVG